ncbi:hypothetical protein [Acetivibrio ethanolgignens]|uniref:Uncharacterized protein n=1 Tax=Acetivibrio ethanolgignens TaxID=290052 RepID=A0A0V8QBP6_9FIRM|nr:hypothetical protein [Acetivibrio ethanolgignens]KSV57916.1 hypothetical protein ASU35_14855 [Acetivibrio ethanolgignens]
MCMYLTNGNYLGQRLVGYDCFDSKSKGFIGMSEKQIVDKLKRGERVYGFALVTENEEDKLVLDVDGFNMCNLQLKSGVNNLSWLNENSDCDMNIALVVVAVFVENGKRVYETVNARHARVTYEESKLRMLIEIGVPVAGVKLDKNRIAVCEGVGVIEQVKEGA